MNRRNKNTLVGILLLIASSSLAQSYVDNALTFSRTKPGGSARIQAMGGAQIALGGDYSSVLSNPAGLGMYNRSEFTFSPAVSGYSTTSNYFGNTNKDGKTILNIPGISLVFHGSKDKDGFLGGSFAVSMSRINDFQDVTTFQGFSPDNTIIDSFIGQANGATTEQFDEFNYQYNTPTGLAYFNFLIGPWSSNIDNPDFPDSSPDFPNDEYFTDAPLGALQKSVTETKGATNQWSFSYGGNYEDIFFFGAGVGISSLRYSSERRFDESFDSDTISSLSLTENLQVRGTGINATVGFILRPANFFQIGTSFTTPTIYGMTDTYEASLSSRWNNYNYHGLETLNNETAATDIVISEYAMTTPFKFSAGVAFISKIGLITGDVEFKSPAQTRYRADDINGDMDFDYDNDEIKRLYKNTFNYRIGAEFRQDIFRVRGGFGVQGNAYQENLGIDNSITNISGGAGIRTKSYFIDLALINSSQKKYSYQPYFLADGSGPVAEIKKNTFTGMVTVGFIF